MALFHCIILVPYVIEKTPIWSYCLLVVAAVVRFSMKCSPEMGPPLLSFVVKKACQAWIGGAAEEDTDGLVPPSDIFLFLFSGYRAKVGFCPSMAFAAGFSVFRIRSRRHYTASLQGHQFGRWEDKIHKSSRPAFSLAFSLQFFRSY